MAGYEATCHFHLCWSTHLLLASSTNAYFSQLGMGSWDAGHTQLDMNSWDAELTQLDVNSWDALFHNLNNHQCVDQCNII